MGLFDFFSGDSERDAAAAKEAAIRRGYSDLSTLFGQGRDALTANSSKAAGYYQPLYDTAMRSGSTAQMAARERARRSPTIPVMSPNCRPASTPSIVALRHAGPCRAVARAPPN